MNEKYLELMAMAQMYSALMPPPTNHFTYVKDTPDVGNNEPCPCGSGKKYKRCCKNLNARSAIEP